MKNVLLKLLFGLAMSAVAASAVAKPSIVDLPGLRPDGSVLLPNQWSLRPVGKQVTVGDFPVNIAVHPDGRFAAVLHSGHGRHEIVIVDIKAAKVFSRMSVHETFYGLEFSHNGKRLYCSGAGDEVVHAFDFKDGTLTAADDLTIRNPRERGIPCGLAVSKNERTLFVANVWGQNVSEIDLVTHARRASFEFTTETNNATRVFTNQAPVNPDLAAITKRAKAEQDKISPDAPFPYDCQLDEKRQRLYVSLWARACVAVVDLKSQKVIERWPTGEHPNEMLLTKSCRYLFVANANRDTVTVIDTSTGKTAETLDASFSTTQLPGATPESVALSPDEKKLFVANACNNNVAVFDVSTIGKTRSLGFIPVGWYPTSVRVTPDGKHLLVANGKGLISRPDPNGPQPKIGYKATQTITELFPGTLSIIDLARGKEFDSQMAAYTKQAFECVPRPAPPATADNPIPSEVGAASPIKYCIYIIKENRTYDQVLGDMKEGNGDPNLCLFGEKVTPNLHKIARDFVLLDNFYVDAEVSADGHEWSMGAMATDFVEKTWPLSYGHNRSGKYTYPSEGLFPMIAPPLNGYLWDRAREAGVSYRSYGEFVASDKFPSQRCRPRLASLVGHIDPWYKGFDIHYSDLKRAARFISDLKEFETNGDMPRLQIVRMGNDHTAGTLRNTLTPRAFVADNDRGVGMLVEAVSHSKFWPQTAIFILEDDAQAGPDHVDAHRSPAYIVSPYTRRHAVDSTMYSTSSMLHTMELILGLKPMTQYDSAAEPMFNSFQARADLTPFDSVPAQWNLQERNSALAWGSAESGKMDFSREDATDEQMLNQIIWHSVRGPNVPMPAPVHAAFVFTHQKADDDDD